MNTFTNTLFKIFEDDLVYWPNPAGAFTMRIKSPMELQTPDDQYWLHQEKVLHLLSAYVLHLKNIKSKREIVLLHRAKYAQELGYYDMLKNLSKSNQNLKYLTTVSRPDHELSHEWRGNVGKGETLLVGKDDCKSQLEKAVGEEVTPENSFFHICGYAGTINAVISILSPLEFVSNCKKRKDGSFDIKVETYI